jgi:hypothetical protein
MEQQYPASVTPWGSQFAMAARSIMNVKVRGADGGDVSCRTSRPSGFGDLEVACWPFVTQVCRFKSSWSCQIFQGKKILSTLSFRGEVKQSVACHRFAACKRSLQWRGSRHCQQNYQSSHPQFHLSLLGSLASLWTWRHLAVKVGTSKEQGNTISLQVVVHPGALAAGPYRRRSHWYFMWSRILSTLSRCSVAIHGNVTSVYSPEDLVEVQKTRTDSLQYQIVT